MWFASAFASILPHLQQLDQDDTPLVQYLTEPQHHRLGLHFERLWSYWLQHNGRYELLGANLQVQHHNQTLGAFDFIVRDRHADEIEHWELAVKFYLGIVPLENPQHWIGPHLNDRLDLKFNHLIHKQLPLSQTLAGQQRCQQNGWHVSRRRLISKGRLFYPLAQPQNVPRCIDPRHLRGTWLTQSQFCQQARQHLHGEYRWLQKQEWMTPHALQAEPLQSVLEPLQQQQHPVQLLAFNWQPQPLHLFVVPDPWQQRALDLLATQPD